MGNAEEDPWTGSDWSCSLEDETSQLLSEEFDPFDATAPYNHLQLTNVDPEPAVVLYLGDSCSCCLAFSLFRIRASSNLAAKS